MSILVVLALFAILSTLALIGRAVDTRKDTGRFDWNTPTNPGRGDPAGVSW
jgi:hypothetical protein